MKGIDVSWHNGFIDWQAVKNAGIEFAICRCAYGKIADETFQQNVQGAHAFGLKCGAYHYSYALTPNDAIIEAKICKDIIAESGVLLELPVFFDMEDADGYKKHNNFVFTKRNVTDICKKYLENIYPLNCGIYASYNYLEYVIDWRSLNCPIWNAQWSENDFIQGFMWQFTDRLLIGDKLFDGNILYEDKDK